MSKHWNYPASDNIHTANDILLQFNVGIVRYSGRICSLRSFTTPVPYWMEIRPLANLPSCPSAVLTPFIITLICGPFAVISKVFQRPPAFGSGGETLATFTMAPVMYSCSGRRS